MKKTAVIATCITLLAIAAIFLSGRFKTTPDSQQLTPPETSTTGPQQAAIPFCNESMDVRTHQLSESDKSFLSGKGLLDPENDLVKDLMKHSELIPCNGELGGMPAFYSPSRIAVLSKDHVIADFEDGHNGGTMELSFTVSQGAISWTAICADCVN